MSHSDIENAIDNAWDDAASITPNTKGEVRDAVEAALDLMDGGNTRVAEKGDSGWHVNQWLKKAVLLSFRLNDMLGSASSVAGVMSGSPKASSGASNLGNSSSMTFLSRRCGSILSSTDAASGTAEL